MNALRDLAAELAGGLQQLSVVRCISRKSICCFTSASAELKWCWSSVVAGLSIWFYEYFTTLHDEAVYMWTQKLRFSSLLRFVFFYCRYGILLESILFLCTSKHGPNCFTKWSAISVHIHLNFALQSYFLSDPWRINGCEKLCSSHFTNANSKKILVILNFTLHRDFLGLIA